jgi:heme exporter protein D
MEHIEHLPFIVGAYVAATIVIASLIVWIMLDYRAQRRALADLEMRGVSRRSAPASAEGAMAEAKEDA